MVSDGLNCGGFGTLRAPGHYHEIFEYGIRVTNGSPLNLALIGHRDGWQPFGTSY